MKKRLQFNLKAITLIFCMFLTNISFSQTLLDEKFEGTAMPAGWTFITNQTNEMYKWTFYDAYDDLEIYESPTTPQNEWVISPSFDLSSFTNIYLSFSPWMFINRSDFASDTSDFKLLVSSNGGVSWTEILNDDLLSTSNFDGNFFYFRTISRSLQSFCGPGMTNVKIGFQFTSTGTTTHSNGTYLMDVKLSTDCPATTLSNFSTTSISWFPIDNFFGTFDIEYGAVGFVQGTGTLVSGLTGTNYNFPSAMCKYDCYIRSNCGGSTSIWNKFTPGSSTQDLFNITTSNSNQINWTGFSTNYDIEYGIGNFTLGTGTLISNVSGFSYDLLGLLPNTNYKYFIRTNCGGIYGPWASSTFTTSTLSVDNDEKVNKIKVYPIPTKGFLNVEDLNAEIESIDLFDMQGRKLTNYKFDNFILDLTNLSSGSYLLQLNLKDGIDKIRIIKE